MVGWTAVLRGGWLVKGFARIAARAGVLVLFSGEQFSVWPSSSLCPLLAWVASPPTHAQVP